MTQSKLQNTFKTYIFTAISSIKRKLPPSQRTSIPVLIFLSYGRDHNGLAYLETEVLKGMPRDYVGYGCEKRETKDKKEKERKAAGRRNSST
jgi:hypothetical protein